MKVEFCNFSGYKIYPGQGHPAMDESRGFGNGADTAEGQHELIVCLFQPASLAQLLQPCPTFASSKEESLFLQRKNPRKIAWTVVYRRVNKKGISEEQAKKRSRKTVKANRGVIGADVAAIQAKRQQKPEVRAAQRAAALAAGKEAKKDRQAKKAAAGPKPAQQKLSRTQVGKGAARGGR
ncbi:60S ribosomal protein L24 [Rhodotorula mucilaginosa]|uniref:60S ribosomal protein L24 n=1 Tax=Rhodotorula mucilaginosa TaxID=5537 RepID=A0A9P7B4Z5_RHOMI|nr:60S ribosomal protein L24 [Rhodotorula mucilaginosa]